MIIISAALLWKIEAAVEIKASVTNFLMLGSKSSLNKHVSDLKQKKKKAAFSDLGSYINNMMDTNTLSVFSSV